MNERIVRIVFILAILVCSSCGTLSRAPKVAGQPTLAESVWVFSQSRPEGFTIDIRSWREPREGISVAYQQTQNRHDRKDLDYVVSHALSHEGFIGGWLNSEDGLYYFDSVRLFPEDSLSAAILFGKANHQDAVYKLSSKQEIRLIEDVEFVSPTNLIIMYDPEIGKEALLSAVKEYNVNPHSHSPATIRIIQFINIAISLRDPSGKTAKKPNGNHIMRFKKSTTVSISMPS